MHISDECDSDAVNALAFQINQLFNKNPDATQRELFAACFNAISDILISIECPGCRKQTASALREAFPHLIKDALAYATKHGGGEPPASGHIH